MAGTALITYLSSLCSPAFTATQYALLSSLALLGRTVVASSGGVLSEKFGWVRFFLLTTVVALPAIFLFMWIGPRDDLMNNRPAVSPQKSGWFRRLARVTELAEMGAFRNADPSTSVAAAILRFRMTLICFSNLLEPHAHPELELALAVIVSRVHAEALPESGNGCPDRSRRCNCRCRWLRSGEETKRGQRTGG